MSIQFFINTYAIIACAAAVLVAYVAIDME
jgi:hypothetical protein